MVQDLALLRTRSGQPLLPNVAYGDFHCFHPQIVGTTATGIVGCSFYVFETGEQIERCSYFFIVS